MRRTRSYVYSRAMMQQSIALRELSEIKHRRMRACNDLQARTKTRRIYALSTALELLAVEMPRLSVRLRLDDAYVVVKGGSERSNLQGVSFVTWQWPLETIMIERKFECTFPVCTWAMMAMYLSLEELVVLGDSMMRRDHRLKRAAFDDFVMFLKTMQTLCSESGDSAKRAFKGMDNCQRALRLMRPDTDSSQETRGRLALMRYGLPCPEVNFAIRNPNTGRPLLLDMAYPEYRVVIEYDGGHHARQWLMDTTRRQVIQDAGWECIQVTQLNLGDEEQEEKSARRVAAAMQKVSGQSIVLTPRQSIRQLSDGRRTMNR